MRICEDDEIEQDRVSDLAREASDHTGGIAEVEELFGCDTFGKHEAVDRAMVVMEMVRNVLLSHPAVLLDRDVYRLIYRAGECLGEAYQCLSTEAQ